MKERPTRPAIGRTIAFYFAAIVVYFGWMLLLAPAYPSIRLVDPVKIGPNTRLGSKSYYGRRSELGWPIVFFAMREEALDTETKKPLRVVATRFSAIAIALNIAGLLAAAGLLNLLMWFIDSWRLSIRMLLSVVFCTGVLLGVGVASRHEFLDPITIYQDEATQRTP